MRWSIDYQKVSKFGTHFQCYFNGSKVKGGNTFWQFYTPAWILQKWYCTTFNLQNVVIWLFWNTMAKHTARLILLFSFGLIRSVCTLQWLEYYEFELSWFVLIELQRDWAKLKLSETVRDRNSPCESITCSAQSVSVSLRWISQSHLLNLAQFHWLTW